MPRSRKAAPPDPDRLRRESAGSYRTTDGRFEARQAGTGWFLVDTSQRNEFGQELMTGPYPTLDAVREAIPVARSSEVASPSRRTGPRSAKRSPAAARPEPVPTPPPPTWIERLPAAEAARVRTLIRAVERDGLPEAEQLVRRDREGLEPALATHLIERRLEAIVHDLPEEIHPDLARRLVRRVAELLTVEGTRGRHPLPGWLLVEVGPGDEPPNRRITVR